MTADDDDKHRKMLEDARAAREESRDNADKPPVSTGPARSVEECRQAWATGTPWPESPLALEFLGTRRGLDLTTIPPDCCRFIAAWRVSKAEGSRVFDALAFPLVDMASGELVGLQVRRFTKKGELVLRPAKSMTSGRKGVFRVGRDDAMRVYLTDGQEDALALWQVIGGLDSGVSCWALTSVSANVDGWPVIAGRRLVFLLDRGATEERAGIQTAMRLKSQGHDIFIAYAPEGFKDANAALLAGDVEAIRKTLKSPIDPALIDPAHYQRLGDDETAGGIGEHQIAEPFFVRGNDIYVRHQDARGDEKELYLCRRFDIKGKMTDRYGERTRVIIEYNGQMHAIPMGDAMLGERIVSELWDKDINVTANRAILSYLKMLIGQWSGTKYLDVGRAGLIEDREAGFMTIGGRYIGGKRTPRPLLFDTKIGRASDFGPAGTLPEWRERIARPALESPHCVLSLGFGLASALGAWLRLENRAVLWSGESATGKTTLLKVCASLFADPEAFVFSAGTSKPAFRNTAYSLHSYPLLLDELDAGPDGESLLNTLSYEHSLGNSPGRVDIAANSNREMLQWRSIMQISGEVDPPGIAARGGYELRGGQELRLLSLSVRGRVKSDGERPGLEVLSGIADLRSKIKDDLPSQYGTAYPRFVEHMLTLKRDAVLSRIESIEATYLDRIGFDPALHTGNVRRAARFFAEAAAAIEIAFDANVFPADLKDASCTNGMRIKVIPFHFLKLWIEQRQGMEAREVSRIMSRLRAWIDENFGEFTRLLPDYQPADKARRQNHMAIVVAPDYAGDDEQLWPTDEAAIVWISPAGFFEIYSKSGFPQQMIKTVLLDRGIVGGQTEGEWRRFMTQCPRAIRILTGWKRAVRIDIRAFGDVP